MSILLLLAVILGLSTFRMWRMIGADSITAPIRTRLFEKEGRGWEFLTDLITCPWCLGWWIAGCWAVVATAWLRYGPVEFVLLWTATSAVCGLLAKIDERLS